MFWAPAETADPFKAWATAANAVKGGHTRASRSERAGKAAFSFAAKSTDSEIVLCIFQLPAIKGRRDMGISSFFFDGDISILVVCLDGVKWK